MTSRTSHTVYHEQMLYDTVRSMDEVIAKGTSSSGELQLPGRLALSIFIATLAGTVFFEAAYFMGWLADKSPYHRFLFNGLYGFELAAILLTTGTLFFAFWRTRKDFFLLSALALFSWFIGSFFFVSYVYLLKRLLVYPSVAEFAFQGFHLIMIVILYNVLKREDYKINAWTAAVIPIITSLPAIGLLSGHIPLNNLIYSTFFMFLISLTTFLVINMLLRRKLLILCLGLALVIVADIAFVETSLYRSTFVFMLDPLWFTGFALTGFGFIRGGQKGELG